MEDIKKQLNDCKNLFKSLPDPGGLLDQEGKFLLVTKAFEQMMGKKQKDLIGLNAFRSGFFEKDFEDVAFDNMQQWLSGKKLPDHDIVLNVKGGKKIIAQTKNAVVSYQGEKCFLFTLRDVTAQRKAEKELLASEEKFRDILMNSSDIIWEVDHKGRIQFISGKVKQILGYTRKELIGKTPYYLMSPPEKKRVKKIFHAHLERRENISDFESVILTKNKEKRVFLTNGVPIFDKEDNLIGYRGVEKDITERKRVEEKFQELFNNMKSGVAVYDVLNNGKKIVFNDFNKAAEEIDHVKLKDIKGKSLLKVFPMSRKLGVYDSIRRVWRTGNSEYFSSNFKLDSGEEVWRDNFIYRLPSGTVVAIYEDVSEKVKVNKKIEENERKFHKIFEASPEAIVILDSESKIVDSNSRVTEWLDYKVDEIRGKSLLEIPFFSDEGKKKVIEKFKEKMKNADKRIAPYEIEFFGKKGEKMIGRIYTRTIRDKNGNPLQDLVMISDVTKNKEEEKKREERQRELEKMNKIMVGRELKMIELKNKIKELKDKLR